MKQLTISDTDKLIHIADKSINIALSDDKDRRYMRARQ
jgi:hypothetical protein